MSAFADAGRVLFEPDAAVTSVLTPVLTRVILMVKGKEGIKGMEAPQQAIGPDLLTPRGGGFFSNLLKGSNPFSIWGVVLTAPGVRVTHKLSKGTAYTV